MNNRIKKSLSILFTIIILFTLVPLTLSGCAEQEEYRDYTYFEMDTYIVIRLARSKNGLGYHDDAHLKAIADECDRIISEQDSYLSCKDESTQLYALNSEISMMLNVDSRLLSAIETADKLSSLTDGSFDYTLGALSELWNVTGGGPVPASDSIEEALLHTGTDKLSVEDNTVRKSDKLVKIDLGGIGKGMATQAVLEYLSTTDISYALVSLGGNIGVYGEKAEYGSYKIGVRDPDNTSGVVGYWFISNGFVSVSGDYERFFEENGKRYHHIIDPATGYPAESGLRSVAVHSSNGAAADALSTALFVMGLDKAMDLYNSHTLDFEAVFITADGQVITTPGIKDDFLFTSDDYTFSQTK